MNNSKARSHLILQGLGLAYVAYLIYELIKGYSSGEMEVSFPVFCLAVGGLSIAAIVLAFFVYKNWKRDKAAEEEGDREEAEQAAILAQIDDEIAEIEAGLPKDTEE